MKKHSNISFHEKIIGLKTQFKQKFWENAKEALDLYYFCLVSSTIEVLESSLVVFSRHWIKYWFLVLLVPVEDTRGFFLHACCKEVFIFQLESKPHSAVLCYVQLKKEQAM
jgi:hypothetical protein